MIYQLELDTLKDEEVEIYDKNKKIAYGQVIILEQNFGIKITSIIDEEDLVKSLI
ncbi:MULTISPECIES: FliM/FliN family flagellar motor switch protein [Terrisporobacter]|uniref:FliM/FliN family flagellar motor switch protein n=1 Tax=Terrisporobacter TaxID=1505652 RepID=UPI0009DE7099|nr:MULTISPECIES: FliM/FliN family flagellar motor switch protein [Terrisporobacter]MCC3669468.1 FliM/FliN family flagellar motor switch protein [Terrisporobacter mayombei]